MATKIVVLDECTINKIAAGEVIENPSSVVKELVDNAIDAGSSEIVVEIAAGGRQLIRVSDDGCGMSADDALLSLERHATSKIRSVEDILSITSMGFRGEAIPSIASISKFTLLTSTEEGSGTMVIVEGGRILRVDAAVRSRGTTIEVKSLFFNVPVRKKFQRSPNYDTNEIQKMLSKLALANPAIAFELISSGKSLLKACGSGESSFSEQLSRRIGDILGRGYIEESIPIDHAVDGFEVAGTISLPSNTRHNRTGQYIFINGRPVFSPMIHNAVREGYSTALPTNRHPLFVLHVKMPGELVDVNVHPQKKEVRVRQESILRRAVTQAVDRALHGSGASFAAFDFEESNDAPFFPPPFENGSDDEKASFFTPREEEEFFRAPLFPMFDEPSPVAMEPPSTIESGVTADEPGEELLLHFPQAIKEEVVPSILGAVSGYFLVDGNTLPGGGRGGFFVVDQRAAHARIIFETLLSSGEGEEVEMQQLLVPLTLELTAGEAALFRENLHLLAKRGVAIREFGKNSFVLEAIPSSFGDIDLKAFGEELLSCLESDAPFTLESAFEKRLAKLAMRLAISKKRVIATEEALSLIKRLFACNHPYHSPSGGATILSFDEGQLAKLFK